MLSLPDVAGKYELVEGELVLIPPATFRRAVMTARLATGIHRFARTRRLGNILGSRLGCWMNTGNLRSPEIPFISRERIKGQNPEGFLNGAPELAVEILSPSDTVTSMKEKAVEYFESGSRLVWTVNPYDQSALVLHPDGSETVLTATDTLDGEDCVPGFSLAIGDLFEDFK